MICGNCEHTDGLIYTSNPPQVKCTITGEFHKNDFECNCNKIRSLYGKKTDMAERKRRKELFNY
jgi:hypothetical protein